MVLQEEVMLLFCPFCDVQGTLQNPLSMAGTTPRDGVFGVVFPRKQKGGSWKRQQ